MDDGYEIEEYQNDIVSEKLPHASEMSSKHGGTETVTIGGENNNQGYDYIIDEDMLMRKLPEKELETEQALFASSFGKWDRHRITFVIIYLLTIFSLIMANAAFVIAFLRCFPICAFNWHEFQDKCYYYSRKQVPWEKARSTCQDLSADLVIIGSEKEQDFLVYNMKEKTSQWIGLRYTTTEMAWKWVDGTNASYT
nr:C-type lectin domain family 2 member B-like [Zootoca vivipara]